LDRAEELLECAAIRYHHPAENVRVTHPR
jgi:hypothetical protein